MPDALTDGLLVLRDMFGLSGGANSWNCCSVLSTPPLKKFKAGLSYLEIRQMSIMIQT